MNINEKIQEWKQSLGSLRERLPIDQYRLEDTCREQPGLYDEVGQIAVEIRAETRKAKDRVDFKEAELSTKIRTNPKDYGIDKVTEGAIASAILLQEEFQKLKREYIDISEIADAFSILQSAVEQRKSMIKDLVSLFVHEYYSSQSLTSEEEFLNRGKNEEKLLPEED